MNQTLLKIDGSYGEGGGQILRSSMALSALSGRPIQIDQIRANRRKPGLGHQHLCAVRAAREICDGDLQGDSVGSSRLDFTPGEIRGGEYSFAIGTAGSCTLVAQTVLLPLLLAESNSTLRIEGGTHNPMAPPVEFLQKVFLPVLSKQIERPLECKLARHGFYPRGGGRIDLNIPAIDSFRSIEQTERGPIKSVQIKSTVNQLPRQIAEREIDVIRRRGNFHRANYEIVVLSEESLSPANFMTVELEYESSRELLIEFGKLGIRAEQVAANLLRKVKAAIKSEAPVGEHLADQLLLPAAVAAARLGVSSNWITGPLSLHSTTHIWLIQQFLDLKIQVEEKQSELFHVRVSPA